MNATLSQRVLSFGIMVLASGSLTISLSQAESCEPGGCPFEIGSKWSYTVEVGFPSEGTCACVSATCVPNAGCYFPKTTITMTSLQPGTQYIHQEVGSANGTPDVNNPPNGGNLRHGTDLGVATGGSVPFDYLDRTVTCGKYGICDVSYASGSCPTSNPQGWGSCSILDLFLVCSSCSNQ